MQRRIPCEDRGRDWSDEFTSQGMPRTGGRHPKLEERQGTDSPSEAPAGTNSGDT